MQSVLASIPNYVMQSACYQLPLVIHLTDRINRDFLWGSDKSYSKLHLIKWSRVKKKWYVPLISEMFAFQMLLYLQKLEVKGQLVLHAKYLRQHGIMDYVLERIGQIEGYYLKFQRIKGGYG